MKRIITLMFFTVLSGCSVYQTKFDCAAPEGTYCKSISEISDELKTKQSVIIKAKMNQAPIRDIY